MISLTHGSQNNTKEAKGPQAMFNMNQICEITLSHFEGNNDDNPLRELVVESFTKFLNTGVRDANFVEALEITRTFFVGFDDDEAKTLVSSINKELGMPGFW
jgi:hypothetical protein